VRRVDLGLALAADLSEDRAQPLAELLNRFLDRSPGCKVDAGANEAATGSRPSSLLNLTPKKGGEMYIGGGVILLILVILLLIWLF
jgi:hypothetical protein